ncbi:MAG TPA: phage tail protein, partial [Thermoanaerobaculia bacterium]|nr:phage tail protein [Thermoanaerobaculia bacterium]
EAETGGAELPLPIPGGLAFDPWCRLFHSLPDEGRIERLLWAARDPLATVASPPEPVDVFASPAPAAAGTEGDFAPIGTTQGTPPPLASPRGLAIDGDGRLFVAETGDASHGGRVLVVDLLDRRLLRSVRFPRPGGGFYRPLDLATDGERVWAALEGAPALATLEARTGPRELPPLPAGVGPVDRLAVSPAGEVFLLEAAGTAGARIVPLARPGDAWVVPGASDLEFDRPEAPGTPALVVAREPGRDLLRFDPATPGHPAEPPRLKARGYDGRGIVRTPDGRIGFWSEAGFRLAVPARILYETRGRVVTYRLDSGAYQTRWGRLFLDACIPKETAVRVHCATADEPPDELSPEPILARTPPVGGFPIPAERLLGESPPMPPVALVPAFPPASEDELRPLHERETGRELPWAPRADGALARFETWEAPAVAAPGRFLWVTLELTGNGRTTPRVSSLRVEMPGHDLLRRIPKTYSRDEPSADFLRRFLSPLDGALGDLDAKAALRRALLDPWSAPAEILPWLASFLGLILDERWPVAARRLLIDEAPWLFRFRGTVAGLTRFLEIYLDRAPILVEHFRVRGLGGAIVGGVGEGGDLTSQAVLGAGFRIGGQLGRPGEVAVFGAATPGGPDVHAHRFTVVVPMLLSAEQRDVVLFVLEEHRPAHTLFDLCAVDAGMRVGIGLYVELSSVVGRGGGFTRLEVGGSALGRTAVLGRPAAGTRPLASRAGFDSVVG